MSVRFSGLATMGMLVLAAILSMAGRSWAIYYGLGPSKDEWGLKYEVEVTDAGGDKVNIEFTLADEGRLRPFYSIEVIAFSLQADSQGRRSYDVKAPIQFKTTDDGRRAGTVQIRKDLVDRARIRILTQMVDGKRQPSGGAYYDIPVKNFVNKAPAGRPDVASPVAPRTIAAPRPSKVTK